MTTLRGWRKAFAGAIVITLGTAGVFAQKQQITGGGATFPYVIYSKWFSEYNKLHPNIEINYQSKGSSFGIQQIQKGTVFFGATDGPMTNDALLASPGRIMHFPTVLGADVPVYNVAGLNNLQFTGPILANIFLGHITKWNDPAIAKANPGVSLPNKDVIVVHRSDGSGTSYIWNDYLAKVSPEWRQKVGVANSVNWPIGLGGPGNEGVAGLVKQTDGAIGYVELIYAIQSKIPYGPVQNFDGNFVSANLNTVTAAAASAAGKMPPDFRVSITNAQGKDAYPISSFTWILMYENPKDKAQAKTMVEFMQWALSDGQKFAGELGYAPLPQEVVQLELAALKKIRLQ
jgi:phosphate transport system substrate-binding protein